GIAVAGEAAGGGAPDQGRVGESLRQRSYHLLVRQARGDERGNQRRVAFGDSRYEIIHDACSLPRLGPSARDDGTRSKRGILLVEVLHGHDLDHPALDRAGRISGRPRRILLNVRSLIMPMLMPPPHRVRRASLVTAKWIDCSADTG